MMYPVIRLVPRSMLTSGWNQPFSPDDQVVPIQPVNTLQHVQGINDEVKMLYELYSQGAQSIKCFVNIPGAQWIWRHP